MSQGIKEIKVTRKPKFVDFDKDLWQRMKAAAAIKGMTISQVLEEAVAEWLAE